MIGRQISDKPTPDDLATSGQALASALLDMTAHGIMVTLTVRDFGTVRDFSAVHNFGTVHNFSAVRDFGTMSEVSAPPVSYNVLSARVPRFAATVTSSVTAVADITITALAGFVFWCKFGIVRAMSAADLVSLCNFARRYECAALVEDIETAVRECRSLWSLVELLRGDDSVLDAAAEAVWACLEADADAMLPPMSDQMAAALMRWKWRGPKSGAE